MMPNTHDPREFYRVTRAILMPSIGKEAFGRVAVEALANGLPVLASDCGALPETLAGAGFVLPLPQRCIASPNEVPTAEEVLPWLSLINRLWDDPAFESEQHRLARSAAQRYHPDRLAGEYEAYFRRIVEKGSP
jgi:glycosyltransferase involved in cell wall biosynthesis